MIVPARPAPGFGRWCWVITNTMRFPETRLSCASSGGALAGCGGAFSFVAVNAPRCVGGVCSPFCTGGFHNPALCILILMPASPPPILGKSRVRKRARTDLCGGRSAMVVPTATVIDGGRGGSLPITRLNGQNASFPTFDLTYDGPRPIAKGVETHAASHARFLSRQQHRFAG